MKYRLATFDDSEAIRAIYNREVLNSTVTFDLVGEPTINPNALPRELRSKGGVVEWQYDELELTLGNPPTWSWSILLSNGWEVVLHFRDVQVQEAQALLPVPRNGHTVKVSSAAQV